MANSNGRISYTDISISDVKEVLNTTTSSLVALCRHSAINKKSRCKPYPFGGVIADGITDDIRQAYNFGMTSRMLPVPGSTGGLLGYMESFGWELPGLPTGEPSEPCRLGDFRGYNHKAKGAIRYARIYSSAGYQYTKPIWSSAMLGGDGYLYGEVNILPDADIRLSELFDDTYGMYLGDLYLTLILFDTETGGNESFYVAQSELPMGDYDRNEGHVSYTALVRMRTTDIDSGFETEANHGLNWQNTVMLGLYPRIDDIMEGEYTTSEYHEYIRDGLVSLDIWGESNMISLVGNIPGFRLTAVNNGAAIYGDGAAGGEAEITVEDYPGHFATVPVIDIEAGSGSPGLIYNPNVGEIRGTIAVIFRRTINPVMWMTGQDGSASLFATINVYRGNSTSPSAMMDACLCSGTDTDYNVSLESDSIVKVEGLAAGTYRVEVTISVRPWSALGLERARFVLDTDFQSPIAHTYPTTSITIS